MHTCKIRNGSPLPALGSPSSLAYCAHRYKIITRSAHLYSGFPSHCARSPLPIPPPPPSLPEHQKPVSQRFLNLPYASASKLCSYSLLNLLHTYFLLSARGEPSHVPRPTFKGVCSVKHPSFRRSECIRPFSGPLCAHQFSLWLASFCFVFHMGLPSCGTRTETSALPQALRSAVGTHAESLLGGAHSSEREDRYAHSPLTE